VPVALEDRQGEESDAAVAEAHGSGGEVIDVCAVQAIGLEFGVGDHVWGFAIALREQAHFPDVSLLRALALATALESRTPLLTPRGHEISPFVRRDSR